MADNVEYSGPAVECEAGNRKVRGSIPGGMAMNEIENESWNGLDMDPMSDTEDLSTEELKNLVGKLMKIVQKQNKRIDAMEQILQATESRSIFNTNEINDLSNRVVELEKYSRKLCLIINNLEYSDNPLQDVLQLFQSLNINIPASNIAACHPLGANHFSPLIVKFIYHADRDVVWRRRSWLKDFRNRRGFQFSFDECLAPKDRKIRSEARQMKIDTFTRKQDVYARNPNIPNSEPVHIKFTHELRAFLPQAANTLSNNDTKFPETPKTLPQLTRKPDTVKLTAKPTKRKFIPSPVIENDNNNSLAESIVNKMIPALVNALNPAKVQRSEANNQPFLVEETEDT